MVTLRGSFMLTLGHTPGAPLLMPMTQYPSRPLLTLSSGTRAHRCLLPIMTPANNRRPELSLTLLLRCLAHDTPKARLCPFMRIHLRCLGCLAHASLWHLPIPLDTPKLRRHVGMHQICTLAAWRSFAATWYRPIRERHLPRRWNPGRR